MQGAIKLIVTAALLGGMVIAAALGKGNLTGNGMPAAAVTAGSANATSAAAPADERVIRLSAKNFEFAPGTITVKKGVPVVLEISSQDRKHGFSLRAFRVRTDVSPGKVSRVGFTPDRTGTFTFSCDVFCGEGHEEMTGTLVVTD